MLSLEELQKGLAGSGLTDAQTEQLLTRLDSAGDGSVSRAEFVAGYDGVWLTDGHHPSKPPDWLAELPPEQSSQYEQRGAVVFGFTPPSRL